MDLKIHTKHRLLIPVFTKQMLRTMRLTVILLLAVCIQTSAEDVYSQITLSERNTPFSEVVRKIQTQSGYDFVSTYQTIQEAGNVTIDVRNVSLQKALEECLKHKPLTYSIIGKTVVLKVQPRRLSEEKPEMISPLITLPPIQKEIRGRVTDENGNPLQGVSISLKGNPTIGTTTNERGDYSLSVGEDDETLVFSSVGFETQEVPIAEKLLINVVLKSSLGELGEVVVTTALGIERQERSLSYNVQQVGGDELTKVQDANFVNALSGKVAGVTINPSSTGVGGSVRVVLRGTKSISGNNNALYVIDGVPLLSLSSDQPGDIFTGMGQTGDGISNFNSDDIESVSVLSGPAAAALYGSDAANGVVMITTKKGSQSDRFSVNVSNTTNFFTPFVMPKFQNTYGSETGSYFSWGEKLSVPSDYRPSDFFQTGTNMTNSINLSTGTDRNQTYFSASKLDANGIIPNNKFKRYNFSFRNSSNFLNERLNLDLVFTYIKIDEQNMLAQGQYFNPLIPIYLFPRGDDIQRYQIFERYNVTRNFKTQYWPFGDLGFQMQNPYWIVARDIFDNSKDRYLTSGALKYSVNDWMNVTGRLKLDRNTSLNQRKYYASTSGLFADEAGAYYRYDINTQQIYSDILINIDKRINNFSIDATAGGSVSDVLYDYTKFNGNLKSVPNLFTYNNINMLQAETDQSGYHDQTQSIFATAMIGYRDMIYLNATGRNDWVSALSNTNSNSIFYPSVGLSGVLTDLFRIKSTLLSFLKARVSYSEVGNAPQRFISIPTYPVVEGFLQTNTFLPASNLEPERTKSFEAGLNIMLWNGKIKLDATAYKSSTYNQLFNPSLSSSSGFTSFFINAGEVENRGIELSASLQIGLGQIKWNSNLIYSLNRNKILKLLPSYTNKETGETVSLDSLDMGGTASARMILVEGGAMGDIYVNTLMTDEHGYIAVNTASQNVTPNQTNFIKAGNVNPKYNIGFRNSFSYKNFDLNILVTARVGGVGISVTQAIMDAFGVSEATATARDNGGATVNEYKIPAKAYYQTVGGGTSGIGAEYVYSATNVRLGEVSLGYDIPVKGYLNWINGLNISITGRNLFMFYNEAPFDPELTSSTGTYYQGIDYFMQPSLRSIGFSVKLKF